MKDEGQCHELCRECRFPDCSYYNFIKSENRCVLWELPNKDCISIGGSKQPSLLECLGMYSLKIILSVIWVWNLVMLLDIYFVPLKAVTINWNVLDQQDVRTAFALVSLICQLVFFFKTNNSLNNNFLNDYICVIFLYWNSGLHLGVMEWMVDVQ